MGGDGDLATKLALVAAAATAAWLFILALSALATRPRSPDPGPATMELGPEPPAVVNLITGGWRLGHEAVPATLLDLAGRRILDIEQIEPERFVVRLGEADPPDLLPFERQVLDHVRRIAHDGVIVGEALTTGPEADSKRWWDRFRKSVQAHARAQGLSQPRWPAAVLVMLGVLALGPALLAGSAVAAIPGPEDENNPIGAFLAIGFGTWGVLMMIVFSLRDDRDTDAGSDAASRWLGVREHLQHDEIFCDLPPAAVAVWDRYIGYGAALDVSVAAVRALPLGAESEDEAWSAYGGKWHVVRIRYPRYLPPGWGRHPVLVTLSGLWWGGLSFAALVLGMPALVDFKNDRWERAPSYADEAVLTVIDLTLAVLAAVLGLVLLRALVMISFALPDVFSTRVVEGRVVRVRRQPKAPARIVVDDGVSSRVRGLVVPRIVQVPRRGSDIRMRTTPRLGYIRDIEVVKQAPKGEEPTAGAFTSDDPFAMFGAFGGVAGGLVGLALGGVVGAIVRRVQESNAGGALGGEVTTLDWVDPAEVSAIVGSPMRVVDDPGEMDTGWLVGLGGPAEQAILAGDGADDPRVVLMRWPDPEAYQRVTSALPAALRRPVPGVGEEAIWFAKHSLIARDGDGAAAVVVGFWTRDEDERRDTAARLAQHLLVGAEPTAAGTAPAL